MGIRNWLFGKTDEIIPPPPLGVSAAPSHQSVLRGSRARLIEVLKPSDAQALASRHGVSAGAIQTLADALAHSQGRAAQFSHPELGGMGQWMSGGMLMIGDMFNHELKAKVDLLCRDVAAAIAARPRTVDETRGMETRGNPIGWWPAGLGSPAAAGSQNQMRYAFFPAAKRLVIDDNGAVSMYDTGDSYLTGISQQQSTTQTLSFSSTDGSVPLSRFTRVTPSIT